MGPFSFKPPHSNKEIEHAVLFLHKWYREGLHGTRELRTSIKLEATATVCLEQGWSRESKASLEMASGSALNKSQVLLGGH